MAQMPALIFEIVAFDEGYVIDIRWPDNTVERVPGLFKSEQAAEECLSSLSFIRWVRERSKSRNQSDGV